MKKHCDNCGVEFEKKHPSQRFHARKCKDNYHNRRRAPIRPLPKHDDYDPGDGEYWMTKDF